MGAKKKHIKTDVINFIIKELQARKEGLSKRDISKLLGVCPGYIWQCENGRQMPSEAVVKRAAKLLGIEPHNLLAVNNIICSEVLSVYLENPVKYSQIILKDKND